MTRVKCPSCETELESEEDLRGQVVQCPDCGYEFKVPNLIRVAKAATPKVAHAPAEYAPPPNEYAPPPKGKNAYFGSFMLGFMFNFVGIFIAHMIDGREGARAALRGLLLEMLAGAVLLAALQML